MLTLISWMRWCLSGFSIIKLPLYPCFYFPGIYFPRNELWHHRWNGANPGSSLETVLRVFISAIRVDTSLAGINSNFRPPGGKQVFDVNCIIYANSLGIVEPLLSVLGVVGPSQNLSFQMSAKGQPCKAFQRIAVRPGRLTPFPYMKTLSLLPCLFTSSVIHLYQYGLTNFSFLLFIIF